MEAILDLAMKNPSIALNIVVMFFAYKLVALVLGRKKGGKDLKD